MPFNIARHHTVVALLAVAGACRPATHGTGDVSQASIAAPATPLVLALDEGERRVRRRPPGGEFSALTTPFILKVDRRNGGSRDLVMGYEDIAPGQAIPPHQHLIADEIIFVHRGSGVVELGERRTSFGPGATIYIPKNVRIALRNTGGEPVSIAFIFSKPGFEELMRENSALEGQPIIPLTEAELAANRARHQWHTVYEPRP